MALYSTALRAFRGQAVRLLWQLGVLGKELAPGKLAEAIALDYRRHHSAWYSAWLS